MPEPEHHSGLTSEQVREALLRTAEMWKQADCDCCSPTPLDGAFDGLTAEDGALLRTFGLHIALSGEWTIDALSGPR